MSLALASNSAHPASESAYHPIDLPLPSHNLRAASQRLLPYCQGRQGPHLSAQSPRLANRCRSMGDCSSQMRSALLMCLGHVSASANGPQKQPFPTELPENCYLSQSWPRRGWTTCGEDLCGKFLGASGSRRKETQRLPLFVPTSRLS